MEAPLLSTFAGLILLAAAGTTHAQSYESLSGEKPGIEIAWASDAFANNLRAGGQSFEAGIETIHFELGTFVAGFNPSLSPRTEWAANWIVLQSADYDPGENQVIQTGTLLMNTAPFSENGQAYIWGYNTKDSSQGAEWIVMAAQNWKWPSVDGTLPVTFAVSDADQASEVLAGSVNAFNGDVFHHMQLELVVPEASGAMLLGIAGFGMVWRRRR